jgi:methionine synthase I (cobalamin-dependent)
MRNFRARRVFAEAKGRASVQWRDGRFLAILEGCCGTDERYIEALAKAAVDHGESAA